MLFNSLQYIGLLAIIVPIYWLLPSIKGRQIALLIASTIFYASWSVSLLSVFFFVMFINWVAVLDPPKMKFRVPLAIIVSLGVLGIFKYTNFAVDNLNAAREFFNLSPIEHVSIILPLGISFYVFQAIAYTLDVKRGKYPIQKSFWVMTLFIMFFPHMLAGPICRASVLMGQLEEKKKFSVNHLIDGAMLLLVGFVMKTCIADAIAPYANLIFATPAKYSGFDNLFGTLGFGIQIYCDFCGYSLMALGSAKLFGIELPYNFDLPYLADSIQTFWRRWHITLSNWLRDYLYISLGGSRMATEVGVYRNLILTMILGGLWHGASWNFIVWGSIHGFALAINRLFSEKVKPALGLPNFRFTSWVLTLAVVNFAWIFFRSPDLHLAIQQASRILVPTAGWFSSALDVRFAELFILFLILQIPLHKISTSHLPSKAKPWVTALSFMALSFFAFAYYVEGTEFIYFQF